MKFFWNIEIFCKFCWFKWLFWKRTMAVCPKLLTGSMCLVHMRLGLWFWLTWLCRWCPGMLTGYILLARTAMPSAFWWTCIRCLSGYTHAEIKEEYINNVIDLTYYTSKMVFQSWYSKKIKYLLLYKSWTIYHLLLHILLISFFFAYFAYNKNYWIIFLLLIRGKFHDIAEILLKVALKHQKSINHI